MSLKLNLEKVKLDSSKSFEKLKKAHLSDIWTVYRRLLKRLPDVSHLKNIVLFGSIATFIIFVLFNQRFAALYQYLPKEPVAGGVYTEGIVGKIEQLNPLYSASNSPESSATSLIFSGLTKKNDNRESIPDLAEKWEVSADNKTYTFTLKDNLKWQDGQKLTADDVVFTIETIQNPDVKSPLLPVWKGVAAKKQDDKTVTITLTSPYAPFISNTDVAIIPKHILSNIPARSLKTAEFNMAPIGSGPYEFQILKNIKDSQELALVPNKNYYGHQPYIEKVVLKTFSSIFDLTGAYARREITGMRRIPNSEISNKSQLPNIGMYSMAIPEYDALYYNLRKEVIKEKTIRDAVSLSISRDQIIKDVYSGGALSIYGPILPGYPGYNPKLRSKADQAAAKAKIAEAGYVIGPDGIAAKGDQKLTLRLVTVDTSEKVREAEIIRDSLKAIGIDLQIEKYPFASFIQDHVRPRDFDMLLVSQNLGADSDIYSFWHSSEVNDPGLNFSGFTDRKLDKYLEQGRTTNNIESRKAKYLEVSQAIYDSNAATYIVWPYYIYGVSRDVKGPKEGRFIDPKNRFWNIENWYIYDKKATII